MSRDTGNRLKRVRRLGQPLPGLTRKNVGERTNPPGQHGASKRGKPGDYDLRLREKQKLRHNFGVREKVLRSYFKEAARVKGDTGQNLLRLLEARLDNIVFRAGFAPTIPAARQLVNHGHVQVTRAKAGEENPEARMQSIPSFQVKVGDIITIKTASREMTLVMDAMENPSLEIPAYITLDKAAFKATINHLPERDDVPLDIQENLIVEHYSRVA